MAMGQDPEVLGEVCGWINGAATKPVWAKMTPNVTDIAYPATVALKAGCEGVAAINTISCIIGERSITTRRIQSQGPSAWIAHIGTSRLVWAAIHRGGLGDVQLHFAGVCGSPPRRWGGDTIAWAVWACMPVWSSALD